MKDSLEIKFTTPLKIDSSAYAVIDFEHTKFAYFPDIKKNDGYYFIKQKFDHAGIYQLNFFLNGPCIASYIIKIKK